MNDHARTNISNKQAQLLSATFMQHWQVEHICSPTTQPPTMSCFKMTAVVGMITPVVMNHKHCSF